MHAASSFAVGRRFEIRRQIGEGGMGVVYEALDRERGELVALKGITNLSPDALFLFKEEFRAFQHLSHPNLVTLGELFGAGDDWYFTMELVHGVEFLRHVRRYPQISNERAEMETAPRVAYENDTVVDSVRSKSNSGIDSGADSGLVEVPRASGQVSRGILYHGDLDERALRRAIAQLVQGIQFIHSAGKVHRDIKNSNVLVTEAGRVVILDFGLAIDSSREQQLESAPFAAGTPLTMAPEQAMAGPVGHAADWYAVGVLLYQALTGRDPFEGTIRGLLAAKIRGDCPDPREVTPHAPADLAELTARLLSVHPEDRPGGAQILGVLGGASVIPPQRRTVVSTATNSLPFVGREGEIEILDGVFSDVLARGEARVVYVHGESGIGKSTLVTRFRSTIERSEPNAIAFSGKCYEHEAVPYKAFDGLIDAVSRHLRKLSTADVRAMLPRHAALLAKTFPVLRRVEAIAELPLPAEDIEPLELRNRVFSALRELFGTVGRRRPVLVAIDDLQWADKDSLAMLTELLRQPGAPPFMLIATIRTEIEHHGSSRPPRSRSLAGARDALRPLNSDAVSVGTIRISEAAVSASMPIAEDTTARFSLGRFRGARFAMDPTSTWPEGVHIHLGHLSERESNELASRLILDLGKIDVDVAAVVRESGGHPLFLDELMRADRARSNADLDDVLWARIQELEADAQRLLEVVCVAPGPMMQAIATRAANLEADVKRIKLLKAAHLVRTTGGTRATDLIEPYHNRVRDCVRRHLSREVRRAYHKRTALVLETSGAHDPEALFFHFRDADEHDKARHYAILAADRARSLLAFDRAATFFAHALELTDAQSPDLYGLRIGLADALANAGRGAEAAKAYVSACHGRNAAEVLELRRKAAEQLLRSGHIDEGLAQIREVLEQVGLGWPKTSGRALASLIAGRAKLAIRGLGFKLRDISQIRSESLAQMDVCWAAGVGLGVVDQLRGFSYLNRHLLMALSAGEPSRIARGLLGEACTLAALGRWDKSRRVLDVGEEVARGVTHPYPRNLAVAIRSSCALLEGSWATAHETAAAAEEALRGECTNVFWELATVRQTQVWALSFLGRMRDLAAVVSLGVRETQGMGDLYALMALRSGLPNVLWLVRDNPERAEHEASDAIAQWSQEGFHVQHLFDLVARTNLDLYRDDPTRELGRLAATAEPIRKSILLKVQLNRGLYDDVRARSLLHAARHSPAQRRDLLREARSVAKGLLREDRPWCATLGAIAMANHAHLAEGDAECVRWLRDALERATACGMALHVASLKWVLGELVGGPEGNLHRREAAHYFASEAVVRPANLARVFVPAFDTDASPPPVPSSR